MYVCIDAWKRGFLVGCRPLVGLDGCFMKGGYKAQLLVAVGIDPNDCIFPIPYGAVDVECRESWTWLWTFMSDKEKGLIVALDELMPHAEKRFCVRHLWKNLCRATTIKGGPELKDLLWNAAKATYPAEYYRRMALMKKKISRICLKRKVAHKYTGAICSKIIKKLEKYKELSSNCWATEAGARKYSGDVWEKLYVVDLDVHTCSCCQWKFFGIPCQHIIPCILQERKNPEEFVQEFYNLDRFKVAYGHVINPLRDIDDYEPAGYLPMQPPPVKVMRGRKQKRMRKTIDE
ncbi:uncharacterized protein LOC121776914 [Salvia splendens]|uniref:uncharacterized protein LOC121776914 n=1 Tax=Salvia splendens TaxID=180675 RepID=UPI001C267D32|nr:uncharacterized protein LOC121776914 [Salvia splendens]